MDLEQCKREYAGLLLDVGVCLKPGELVEIRCDVNGAAFAEMVAEEAYLRGAVKVNILWQSARLESLELKYAEETVLSEVTSWEKEKEAYHAGHLPCLIYLLSAELMSCTAEMAEKQARVFRNRLESLLPWTQVMRDKYKWTVGGVPTLSWANLVYPDAKDPLKKLWDTVLQTVMVNGDGNSTARWRRRWTEMERRLDWLNSLRLKQLHITTSLGTDLTIGLIPGCNWCGGKNREEEYAPNLPTEELFTTPAAGNAEGKLVSSCPMLCQGQLIQNLVMILEKGRVTQAYAKEGQQAIQGLLDTDEGARMLGEVALVEGKSKIRKTCPLMYHTLYDENAACHVAIGRGYAKAIHGYQNMDADQLKAAGINHSGIHYDIMIGTEDINVSGICEDGSIIKILSDGKWQ